MLEAGGELDLAEKALGPERGGELGVEHLDGDRAVVLEVAGELDGGHAPATELALERVAVPQAFAQAATGSVRRHGDPSPAPEPGWFRRAQSGIDP